MTDVCQQQIYRLFATDRHLSIASSFKNLYAIENELVAIDSSVISMLKENRQMIMYFAHNNIAMLTNSANISADFFYNKRFHLDLQSNNITRVNLAYYQRIFNITMNSKFENFRNCAIDARFNSIICDCSMYEPAFLLRNVLYPKDIENPVFDAKCFSPPALNGIEIIKVKDTDFNCSVVEHYPRGCSCMETLSLKLLTIKCQGYDFGRVFPDKVPVQFQKIDIHIQTYPYRTHH